MPKKLAIRLYTGFGVIPSRYGESSSWTGFLRLEDLLAEEIPQQNLTTLCTGPWNSDTQEDARLALASGADEIWIICHSYGWGKAGKTFCDAVAKIDPRIKVRVVFVDPVIYYPALRPVSRLVAALLPNSWTITVPGNVAEYMHFRTVNEKFLAPWGRDVVGEAVCLRRVAFGKENQLRKWKIEGETRVSDRLHGNLDDEPILHRMIVDELTGRLAA